MFDRRLSEIYADAGIDTGDAVDQLDVHGSLDSLVEDIPATADLLERQDDAPIIRLINGIIAEGARQGASDIHLEPSAPAPLGLGRASARERGCQYVED